MTRGMMLNNPGNLRSGGKQFVGEVVPSRDREFREFDTLANGLRALARTFHTYQKRYGYGDLYQAISRFAPPSENNTSVYIDNVIDWTGSSRFDVDDTPRFSAVLRAVIRQEQGYSVAMGISEATITEAIGAARVVLDVR